MMRKNKYLLIVILTVLFALIVRNAGLYPTVFPDEFFYMRPARTIPLNTSTPHYPNFLHSLIFRASNIAGDKFFELAKILNALFFVSAAPFIYLTARRICTSGPSILVVALALLSPLNRYTAHFMPDSLYYFFFWISTWYITGLVPASTVSAWMLAGILHGLAALVKPHAIFVVPAILLLIAYLSLKKDEHKLLSVVKNAGVFLVALALTKLIGGYLIAGKYGLTVIGSYDHQILGEVPSWSAYAEMIRGTIRCAFGHGIVLAFMFGVPLAFAIHTVVSSFFSKSQPQPRQIISFYLLGALACLISTISISSAFVLRCPLSLHLRLYSFLFPLFIILAISLVSTGPAIASWKWKLPIIVPIGIGILYVIFMKMSPYYLSWVDCPDVCGFRNNKIIFYLLGSMSLITLIVWTFREKLGAALFAWFFLPMIILIPSLFVSRELYNHIQPSRYDRAGIFLKQYLPDKELTKLRIVGPDDGGGFLTLFYLDKPWQFVEYIPDGEPYDVSHLLPGEEWLLIFGEHQLNRKPDSVLELDGFKLIHFPH